MSLEEFINIVIDLITRYSVIVAILAVLSLLLIFFNFFNAASSFFSSIFKLFKNICLLAYRFCKFIFNFIFKLGFIFSFIYLIKRFIDKIIERYRLKHSIYNIYPAPYQYNLFQRIFSPKLRKQLSYRYDLLAKCFKTHDIIDKKFSYLVMIEASVGGGKTSFINGYSHYRTILFQEKIEETILSIEKRFYYFDFNPLRDIVKKLYQDNYSEKEIIYHLYKNKMINDTFSKNNVSTDYVSLTPNNNILKTYVEAYVASLRNNYVFSNYKLYSRITNNYNYELSDDYFNIKDKESLKKFYIPSYSLFIEDEKALSNYKNTSDYRKLSLLGQDTVLRLFRQLKNETAYYISSSQNTSRIAPLIRELANSYIRIISSSIVGNLPLQQRILQKKENRVTKKMFKKARKNRNKEIDGESKYLHGNNPYKEKLYKLWDKRKKLTASAFLKYRVRYSTKLASLDDPNLAEELTLIFPLSWCYGNYRKCEYSDFYDFLMNESEIHSDQDLKEISSLYESNEDRFKAMINSPKALEAGV